MPLKTRTPCGKATPATRPPLVRTFCGAAILVSSPSAKNAVKSFIFDMVIIAPTKSSPPGSRSFAAPAAAARTFNANRRSRRRRDVALAGQLALLVLDAQDGAAALAGLASGQTIGGKAPPLGQHRDLRRRQ